MVAFRIGMRWTHLWRLAREPWVLVAFGRMIREPNPTALGVTAAGPYVQQRFADDQALHEWARSDVHRDPWVRFAREHGPTEAWGIWHETYRGS